ncbi:hypothetical protein Tco_0133968 [Tanacetum coccineum]
MTLIAHDTEDGNTSSDADTFYLGDEASVKKKEAEVAKRPEKSKLLKFVRIEKDKAEKALACSKHAAATTQLKAKAAAERVLKRTKERLLRMADNLTHRTLQDVQPTRDAIWSATLACCNGSISFAAGICGRAIASRWAELLGVSVQCGKLSAISEFFLAFSYLSAAAFALSWVVAAACFEHARAFSALSFSIRTNFSRSNSSPCIPYTDSICIWVLQSSRLKKGKRGNGLPGAM